MGEFSKLNVICDVLPNQIQLKFSLIRKPIKNFMLSHIAMMLLKFFQAMTIKPDVHDRVAVIGVKTDF